MLKYKEKSLNVGHIRSLRDVKWNSHAGASNSNCYESIYRKCRILKIGQQAISPYLISIFLDYALFICINPVRELLLSFDVIVMEQSRLWVLYVQYWNCHKNQHILLIVQCVWNALHLKQSLRGTRRSSVWIPCIHTFHESRVVLSEAEILSIQ